MIIPKYWAEARLQHRERERQVTVRRFGWSDVGLEEAQAHADGRVRAALARVLAGEALPRRERRVAYNGSEGVPIREEIVERDGETVITRNGYGALCLNTPNVFFADVDFDAKPGARTILIVSSSLGLVVCAGLRFGLNQPIGRSISIGFAVALILGYATTAFLLRLRVVLGGGHERLAIERIRAFLRSHPEWRLRLYRTPAGLRLLALHRVFDPRESEVEAAFEALRVDPIYARMCFNQNCFRARVSPKPWRLGLQRLRSPYSAAWRPEHAELPARLAWIAQYDRASANHAACRYLDTLGTGRVDIAAERVQGLHDRMCRAELDLPLA
jgi:hypothetical protein